MRASIAIDMDDTVADTLSRHISWYKQRFGIVLAKEQLAGKSFYDAVQKEHRSAVQQHPHEADFFDQLDVIDNAVEVIQHLSQSYDIFFASAAMEYPSSFPAKYRWLRQHFPFISPMNYIFCGYKGMLNCDYLIDDSPRHLDNFKQTGLLFSAPHNSQYSNYQRVQNWQAVKSYFAKLST
ncbi:5' nucleotidase, NT5C type [Agaribacterium haliotis]|uniref:5' nucleotidase, NT5C type n=1 Tax=Agaribacterium haliotis TaxID=2013869 RepID=UPI000BB55EB3|nr:5'-3'-deoxyribonucleotidase [Agaribacterium haliotis]